jgi:two-component system NtrC family sensor kinase
LTHLSVDGATHDHLVAVQGLVNHLREMARNLSLFARDPEQEGITGRTDIADWFGRVRRFLEASMRGGDANSAGGVRVEFEIAHDLPEVPIAPHRLTQVIINLLNNARVAVISKRIADRSSSEPGLITMRARHDRSNNRVVLEVADNGCGMDEQTRRRAIEPFFTTRDRPAAPGMEGAGMGLALVHSIVERAGGTLEIRSKPHEGTTVVITLACVPPLATGS